MEVTYSTINERSAGVTEAEHDAVMKKRVAKKIGANKWTVIRTRRDLVFDLDRGIHLTRTS